MSDHPWQLVVVPRAGVAVLRRMGIVALVLMASIDVVIAVDDGAPGHVVAVVVACSMVAWPRDRWTRWRTPEIRGALAATVTLATTIVVAAMGLRRGVGPGEILALLALSFVAVRHGAARLAGPVATLVAISAATAPGRYYLPDEWNNSELLALVLVVSLLAAITAGLGGYARSLDNNRRWAIEQTRRDERIRMAADLHDFVAHHLTGALVQVRVAKMMAPSTSPELGHALDRVERSAVEAMAALRSTVASAQPGEVASREPLPDLRAIETLLEEFNSLPGPTVTLGELPPDAVIGPELQATVHRVVTESLTNIRRHASSATRVTVEIGVVDGLLVVDVENDGPAAEGLALSSHDGGGGGGFGLVALGERLDRMGGTFDARPQAEGGWRTTATMPLPR